MGAEEFLPVRTDKQYLKIYFGQNGCSGSVRTMRRMYAQGIASSRNICGSSMNVRTAVATGARSKAK